MIQSPLTYFPTTAIDELLPQAIGVVIPSLSVGVESVGSYTYIGTTPENNKPIYADGLILSGTEEVGEILTLSFDNLSIPNGGLAGAHVYRWYRCNNTQSSGILIDGETSSTYTIVSADDGKFIRAECDPVQTTGLNQTGNTLYSIFSERISSDVFNPVVDISWDTAFLTDDYSSGIWTNSGGGLSAVQDGSANTPVFNSGQGAVEFTRSNSERLKITNQGQSQPLEFWIKFRLKSLTGTQHLVGWNSSMFISINSSGNLSVCQAPAIATGFVINTDYTIRILINGTSTTVQINNGSETTITSGVSTNGLGSSTGQIGSSHATTPTNHLDGYIYDYFIKQTALSSTDQTNMWTWFGF